MERERSGKVIAIATLLVGILGLSLGFAAFSTTLNITSSADVPVDASVWNVGFSDQNSSIHAGTVNGTTGSNTSNGALSLTQFVISQTTNAELSTTNGSKVEYDFYIVNDGDLAAYLNSVTMGTISCEYKTGQSPRVTDNGHTTITSETVGSITDADCQKMFGATLTINSSSSYTDGQSVTSGFGNTNKLDKPSNNTPTYVPVKLTIAYKDDSLATVTDAPTGDFTVSLSDSAIVYGSNSN